MTSVTTQEVKRYLNTANAIEEEIKSLIEERQIILSSLIRSSQFSDMKVQSVPLETQEDKYVDIIEYALKITDRSNEQIHFKIKLANQIDQLETPNHRQCLRYRYIIGLDWESVAEHMGYVPRQIYRIHGEALIAYRDRFF